MSRWQPLPEEYIGPVSLTLWILFMSALGFFTGPMNSVSVWYQLLTAAMPSLAIMLLWLTCLSDPGMIPPSCTRDPIIDQLEFARAGEDEERHSQTPKEGYSKEPGERGAWTRTLIREGVPYTEKYCATCNIWRPPRSHHCNYCNGCIEKFDHHCGVVGNCVAKNNHRFFASFMVCGQIGCALFLGVIPWQAKQALSFKPNNIQDPKFIWIIFLGLVYAYHVLALVFGTLHCMGVCFDITTKDLVSRAQQLELLHNMPCLPGARSLCHLVDVWSSVLCAPLPSLRTKQFRHFSDSRPLLPLPRTRSYRSNLHV
uniref:S-acyltransferase n=1 Tax=Dunaliella tertiolecta TaxID=3047 RepID=A0A7S3QRW8_DUNTE|mmetsp:Transcript_25038/g.68034  ORF Transcript_25038/g.68034 Transcript_25038/m.68034 type:complete len:313 (-) Transcript_25038:4674-5612(-)